MTAERTLLSGWKFEAAWRRLTPYIGPLLFSVGLLIMTDLFWREVARSRGHAAFAATVSSMQERLVGRLHGPGNPSGPAVDHRPRQG